MHTGKTQSGILFIVGHSFIHCCFRLDIYVLVNYCAIFTVNADISHTMCIMKTTLNLCCGYLLI